MAKYEPTELKAFEGHPEFIDGVDFVVTSFQVDDVKKNKRVKKTLPNYECAHCAYSHFEEHRIIEHLMGGLHPYGFGLDDNDEPHTKHPLLRD